MLSSCVHKPAKGSLSASTPDPCRQNLVGDYIDVLSSRDGRAFATLGNVKLPAGESERTVGDYFSSRLHFAGHQSGKSISASMPPTRH